MKLSKILLLSTSIGCSPTPDRTPSAADASACDRLACKLASLDAGQIGRNDDTTSVAMQTRIATLAAAFPESEAEIGDMTVRLRDILAGQGQSESLSTLMQGFTSLPHPSPGVPRYAEAAAVYGTLRQRGQSHDAALASLRSMLKDLGRLQ
jgi:hypothetical protein